MATYTNYGGQYQTVKADSYPSTASVCHVGRRIVEESVSADDPELVCESKIQGRSGQPVGVLVSTLDQCLGVLHGSHPKVMLDEWQHDRHLRRVSK